MVILYFMIMILYIYMYQNDFHMGGSMPVNGSDADNVRISEMIE
jgi:hypothetical protein